MILSDKIRKLLKSAENIAVIQAENPDGDSLGSALALEEILGDAGKRVSLYCPVEIPKYLRYFSGWDRINSELDTRHTDLYIIVDTASRILLSKVLENPNYSKVLHDKPVIVIDHHTSATPDLEFSHEMLLAEAPATGEIIYNLAQEMEYRVSAQAAEHALGAILSDTLGLSTPNITPETFFVAGELTKLGAKSSNIEEKRREFMKKAPEILAYKGELIKRIEYFLDGKLALVHIPWDEIREYSDKYNPSVLVIDEMRLVEGVEICVALKTYPDGKLTGKIRTNTPVAADLAGYFGGGGHAYAAGFRVYEDYETILRELVGAADKIIQSP
jgi:phosphoesterase RecJ-like protein